MCATSVRTGKLISGSHIRHELSSAKACLREAPSSGTGAPDGNPWLYPLAQCLSVLRSAPRNAVRNGAWTGTGHCIDLSSQRGQCNMCTGTHKGFQRIRHLKYKYFPPEVEIFPEFLQTKKCKELRLSSNRLSGKNLTFTNGQLYPRTMAILFFPVFNFFFSFLIWTAGQQAECTC